MIPTVSAVAYEAARHGAGLISRADRGRIVVSGVDRASYLSDTGNRSLSAPAFATFLTWQQEVRDAINAARDRRLRPQLDEIDWTTRI